MSEPDLLKGQHPAIEENNHLFLAFGSLAWCDALATAVETVNAATSLYEAQNALAKLYLMAAKVHEANLNKATKVEQERKNIKRLKPELN